MENAPKVMSLHLLEEITSDFSKDKKLGGGAYGDVYLGEHKDGEMIAVKVLKDFLCLDHEEFEKEYQNLASLHHKNVVRLVGYCNETKREYVQYNGRYVLAEKTKRALCFEYMHNGSLDKFISDESNAKKWSTRYEIIKGICKGLEYLHEKSETTMYHLDLKPANVLLDKNMSPKIADFGLSRLFGGENSQITKSAIGTHGYVPPEYKDAGVISIKFDIFSLGIVIIKIMTGLEGYFRTAETSPQQFIELVYTDWMNRLELTPVHKYAIQVRRCIEIALSCVEADRHKRPSIGVIVNNLNKMEYTINILDKICYESGCWIDQICPCISNETVKLDIVYSKLISYPLHVTDNKGKVHEATITTIGDPTVDTSNSEHPVRPKIKIIDCTEDLSFVCMIDVHPIEPWILVGHINGHMSIWNHRNQTRVFVLDNKDDQGKKVYNKAAKFIELGEWLVVGDSLGYIHVYSYVKMDKLQKFRAHANWVNSLAVHPSEPFVLSASADKQIKLWNWEVGWQCIRKFEGHSSSVLQVKFNPQADGNTFASTSLDCTLKIWNIHSSTPVSTLDCKYDCQEHLDYFISIGDLQYLVTSSYVKALIWDLQTNTCIKEIKGLQPYGSKIDVVETLPGRRILLKTSIYDTVAFCDSTTHSYENMINFDLGYIRGYAYINKINSLAIGCQKGIAIMEMN